jgi:hypothetical protein
LLFLTQRVAVGRTVGELVAGGTGGRVYFWSLAHGGTVVARFKLVSRGGLRCFE